jgi:hypothetical protein
MKHLFTVLLLLLSFSVAFAQEPYSQEALVESEYGRLSTNQKVNIIAFVTAMEDEEEHPEFLGDFYDAWQNYLHGRKLKNNEVLIVDVKNGYMHYEQDYADVDGPGWKGIKEECYWNCSDGKHKLICENVMFLHNGKPSEGQYDGIQFVLYDNATRQLNRIWDKQIIGIDDTWGYDSNYSTDPHTNTAKVKDWLTGEPKTITLEEFNKWLDEKPTFEYHLPRQGKNIELIIHTAQGKINRQLVWDGLKFRVE